MVQHVANPTGAILSAAMMLEWLDDEQTVVAGKRVVQAVRTVMSNPERRTPDMGGTLSTEAMGSAVIAALQG